MISSARLPVLRCLTLTLFSSWLGSAEAVGLGAIRIQSSLGQTLKATIPLIGSDTADLTSTCIKTRLQTADGATLGSAIVAVSRSSSGDAVLLSSTQIINEPAILIDVTVSCGAVVHRDFSILLDPIGMLPTTPDSSVFSARDSAPLASRRERRLAERSINRVGSDDPLAAELTARQSTSATLKTANGNKTAAPSTFRPAASVRPTAPRKNVLKLSNEGFTDAELAQMGHLKLSNSISDSAQPMDAAQRDDLLAARLRFAQVLRGEDPSRNANAEIVADVRQIAVLRSQLANANRQRVADKATISELKQTSAPLTWLIVAAIALLLSLLVVGWLAWRLKNAKKQADSAWDQALASPLHADAGSSVAHTLIAVPLVEPAAREAVSRPMNKTVEESAKQSIKQTAKQPVGTDFGHHPAPVPTQSSAEPSMSEPFLPQAERSDPISNKSNWLSMPTPMLPNESPKFAAEIFPSAASIADQRDALQFYPSKLEHLKVEEISDVIQEAEFWMSLNDPQRAIEILEPYANIAQPDSPIPWLYLLDLYRGTDQRQKYSELHDKASRVFNARIPLWDEDGDVSDGRTLEDFPHVVEQICALWETDKIFAYLESLIFDKREGIREGFDLFVYQEIMMLLTMVRSYGREQPSISFGGLSKQQLALDS